MDIDNSIDSAIRMRANQLASQVDADDLYQGMMAAIIEKANSCPDFLNQKAAYIIQFATWTAKNMLAKERTYSLYIEAEVDTIITAEDDGDEVTVIDLYPSQETTESVMDSDNLVELISTLSPSNREIVRMLYLGYSKAEVADELGISRAAISQRMATISKALSTILE